MGKPKASNRINVKHFPVAQEIEILQFTDQKVKEVAQFQRKRNEMVHYLSFQGRCTYWATNIAVKQKERSSLKREICQKMIRLKKNSYRELGVGKNVFSNNNFK